MKWRFRSRFVRTLAVEGVVAVLGALLVFAVAEIIQVRPFADRVVGLLSLP